MLEGPFALAVAAGMAATVNPCGFALLPAYLAAFVGEEHQPGVGAVPRAFAVALTAGFVVVFGLFGAVISPLAVSIEWYLPWATIVIGVALVGLGGWLLAGRELMLRIPKLSRGGRDGSLASMFLFGVSYAVASLSCTIDPFLAVTSSTFGSSNVASGIGVFVAYALGMGAGRHRSDGRCRPGPSRFGRPPADRAAVRVAVVRGPAGGRWRLRRLVRVVRDPHPGGRRR